MNAGNRTVRAVPWPSWRELTGSPPEMARDFGIAALLAAWVAIIGPFGNDKAGPIELRLAYHMSLSVIVVALYRPGVRLGIAAGARLGMNRLLAVGLAILVISIPMSFVVSVVAVQFFPQLREILSPVDWYVQVVALILPIALALQVISGALRRSHVETPGGLPLSSAEAAASTQQLPVNAELILAIEAEDHYLRVHTAEGSQLVYLTMANALKALEKVDGLQTHRSWWIARRCVTRISRRGRGAEIELANGIVAPVARSRMAALKAARWLD
jgi:DNA-binding LytR/AlgR family response regulator